jgi:putative FmdB family regulatory protein
MPIYEYRCDSCGHELDALQKLSDDPLKDCPGCNTAALRRLISAPSFRLKGDGWYETDFKSDKETKRNLVDGGGSKESKDSKPANSGSDTKKSDSGKSTETKSTAGAKKDSGAAAK